jgi:MoaA/NifB/PqqE/SkfB family radical SAM enzyme
MANKILHNYLPEFYALCSRKSGPRMVTVNLTSQCNQNCIYCEIGKNLPSVRAGSLTKKDLFWIIDEMALIRIPKISLCGGEPFLFNGIIDVVEYAGKKKIRCTITSNGMTIHKLNESELTILKYCKTEVNISVDSFKEEVQSFTRGKAGTLENIWKSIARLNEWHIPVTLLTVITKFNYRELSTFLITAYENGIRQVLFQPVIYYSNYPDRPIVEKKSQLNVEVHDIGTLIDELKKILLFERKHRIKTNVYRILPWVGHYLERAATQNGEWFFHKVLKNFYCRDLYAIIDISYDGGIQPCPLSLAKISILGNHQSSLLALWLNATTKIKDDISSGNYYEICNACCNHFSRNMIASVMKYPVKNRETLGILIPLLVLRFISVLTKKLR